MRLQGGDALCRHEASRIFFMATAGTVTLFVDGLEYRAVAEAASTQVAAMQALADHALLRSDQVRQPLCLRMSQALSRLRRRACASDSDIEKFTRCVRSRCGGLVDASSTCVCRWR